MQKGTFCHTSFDRIFSHLSAMKMCLIVSEGQLLVRYGQLFEQEFKKR